MAVQLDAMDIVDEAVEYTGRSLWIRLKHSGVGAVSQRVAESHFLLGSLYFKKECEADARKELTAGPFLPLSLFLSFWLPCIPLTHQKMVCG
jgi:hypothetical protein